MILLAALIFAAELIGGGILGCIIAGEIAVGIMWCGEKLQEHRDRRRK